jgi:multiple sugar transport system permease protein
MNAKSRRWWGQLSLEGLSLGVSFLFLAPLLWLFLGAFKAPDELFGGPLLPQEWKWENFVEAWRSAPFGRFLLNSLVVSSLTTLSVGLTSALAAFALARMEFPFKPLAFLLALGTLMIPGDALLIPNFLTIRNFGWINTYWALIVPFAASGFGIFLLRNAFLQTPRELDDSARLDGATPLTFLFRILLPVNAPALSALSVLTFLSSWNALVWPFVATNRNEWRTAQVGLASFNNIEGNTNIPVVLAATFIVTVPVLLVYFLAQKWFIESAASSGLKG